MAQRYFRDRSTDLIFIVLGVLCYSATYCSCEEAGIPKVRSLSSHNYVSKKFNQASNIPHQRALIKRRRKRVKTKHSGEQIVKDRQIVNLEAFFNQFSFLNFNQSSWFSSVDAETTVTTTAAPTRYIDREIRIAQYYDINMFFNYLIICVTIILSMPFFYNSLPSFGSILGYGQNGESSPALFILRAR